MDDNDITLWRGETLDDLVFALEDELGAPIDLTGASARLEVVTVPAPFDCGAAPSATIIELLSTSGSAPRLTIAASDGEIALDVSTTHTSAWAVGTHRYRLWVTDALGATFVAFEGRFTVS